MKNRKSIMNRKSFSEYAKSLKTAKQLGVLFGIVEDPMCVCLQDYETVDHLIWHCERFGSERHRLIDALSELDVLHGTPDRDLCGLRKWSAIKCCLDFLESLKIGF
jgi:hypothetical protein